ncbi:MAG: hypothetical protein AABZ55_15460, partial [Bdellovibrionota bacterium]
MSFTLRPMLKNTRTTSAFLLASLIILLSACASVPPLGDALGISPDEVYKVFETKHFRITFTDTLADASMKVANDLEQAHALLSPILRWEPGHKTPVILLDSSDLPNGLTMAHGGVGIILYLTPPDNSFSTSQYDDWLRLLIIHEYTHFLNLDATRDFWGVLRYGFGNTLFPNAFWPTWMLEGLAGYMETRFTNSGRGRSPYYEMVLRTAVNAGVLNSSQFVTLDRLDGEMPYFPSGEIRYLFGYQMMSQVARSQVREGLTTDGISDLKDGEDALGLMSYRSAARFPYFIDKNLSNIIGRDWYEYWDIWLRKTESRVKDQTDRINSEPLTRFRELTQSYQVLGLAASPDGNWLAFGEETLDRRSGLHLLDLKTMKKRRLTDKILGSSLAFTPDSQTLIYSSVERRANYYLWSDLWAYDLESSMSYPLTHSLRAKDPDVSYLGDQVVFTINGNAKTSIAIARLVKNSGTRKYEISEHKVLYYGDPYDHASNPKFTPDGKWVVFSLQKNGVVGEDLVSVEIETGVLRTLVSNTKLNRYPTITKDGDIYYVSDLSGVPNLYLWKPDLKSGPGGGALTSPGYEMVTNFLSGITSPCLTQSGDLYAAHFSYTGWNLSKIELDGYKYSYQKLTLDRPPVNKSEIIEDRFSSSQASLQRVETEKSETRAYSPWSTLVPRQWFPYLQLLP